MEINSFLLRNRTPIITLAAAGPVGTAVTTVDVVSNIGVTATAANLTFTLPAPTDTRSGRDLIVTNTGTNAFTILGMQIDPERYCQFIWEGNDGAWQTPAVPLASGADFFRSGSLTGLKPDGTTDVQDAIYRSGQVVIDTGAAGDSGMTYDDLRSRNSVQAGAGEVGVTDTNMTAVGVDLLGKVRLSNALAYPDLRATNPAPQDFAAGTYYAFKQSGTVGLTAPAYPNIPLYVGLETTRRYASGTDFSGGPVIQRVFLEDGRAYYRTSTNGTTWGVWSLESKEGDTFNLQDMLELNGRIFVSKTGEITWDDRFRIMTAGARSQEPSGLHDIFMPAVGSTIAVGDGTTRTVAAATAGDVLAKGGVLLNPWEALWYRVPKGSTTTSVPANFRIMPYTANGNITNPNSLLGVSGGDAEEWVLIATRTASNHFRFGNGETCAAGGYIGRSNEVTGNFFNNIKTRAMGDGYYFVPAGNTTVPLAFGFTGAIRWINGGAQSFVTGPSFFQINPAMKAAGTTVYVLGGANRTWRLMTAAEKPSWFGGALRGVNPIDPATTTVVDMNDLEMLCWIPDMQSSSGSVGSWYIFPYAAADTTLPVHALPVASKQNTAAHSTIQVLIGGLQYALKVGDATYTTTPADHFKDASRRRITHKGLKYCRWTSATFFSGTADQGALGSAQGLMISWDNNTLMYGLGDGYVSWGHQYSYINVPTVGTRIPVTNTGSNITRVVQSISGRAYIPLGNWEALYYIPPAYTGGTNSAVGDFVIGYYNGSHAIPANAVMVAKVDGAVSFPNGSTIGKTRVLFADGTYMQPGSALVTGTPTQNDHAQGSGDWRPLVYPGQTGPGMTAAMPATVGVVGAYGAPYTAFYRYLTLNDDPRGNIQLEGLIQLNNNIAANGRLAFLPGVSVRGNPIVPVQYIASTFGDDKPIMGEVRFNNVTVNGSQGVEIVATGGSFTAANPYRTLGVNGGASAAGVPLWVSLNNITLPHA